VVANDSADTGGLIAIGVYEFNIDLSSRKRSNAELALERMQRLRRGEEVPPPPARF